MRSKTRLVGCVLLLGVLTASLVPTLAAPAPERKNRRDWPQWRGPNRDNFSTETGLLPSWPPEGPKLLWTSTEVGLGYSGPAIVGDRLYTLGSDERSDFVLALDTRTGRKVWSTPIAPYVDNGWGGGPRSTPTVEGDRLYALSASGQLACLQTSDGKKVWSVSLAGGGGLGGNRPNWNYCESPLVDGDQVVCTPGGARGSLAALDKKTGKVRWRSTALRDPAGYSSIVPASVGGVRQYVQLTMNGVAGVAAKDGRLLWYYPHPGYTTAVIPTPIVHDNYVYAAAGYGAGDVLLELKPNGNGTKAQQLYDDQARRVMDNKHEGMVLVGDYVYGWSDRNRGVWVCQELKTGKVMWQANKLGRGSITAADGRLYCYSEDRGTVVLVSASPDPAGWKEEGRFTIPRHSSQRSPSGGVWTHPVIANGRLYLRDQELLFCYDVKAQTN
jgi:outer membrane protein assembly factor BamB